MGEDSVRQLTVAERLQIFFGRLRQSPACRSAEEALELIGRILTEVEDEFSGCPQDENPGLKFAGRMYPPQDDRIRRFADGAIEATTRRHIIGLDSDGAISIRDSTGTIIFSKPGAHRGQSGGTSEE